MLLRSVTRCDQQLNEALLHSAWLWNNRTLHCDASEPALTVTFNKSQQHTCTRHWTKAQSTRVVSQLSSWHWHNNTALYTVLKRSVDIYIAWHFSTNRKWLQTLSIVTTHEAARLRVAFCQCQFGGCWVSRGKGCTVQSIQRRIHPTTSYSATGGYSIEGRLTAMSSEPSKYLIACNIRTVPQAIITCSAQLVHLQHLYLHVQKVQNPYHTGLPRGTKESNPDIYGTLFKSVIKMRDPRKRYWCYSNWIQCCLTAKACQSGSSSTRDRGNCTQRTLATNDLLVVEKPCLFYQELTNNIRFHTNREQVCFLCLNKTLSICLQGKFNDIAKPF